MRRARRADGTWGRTELSFRLAAEPRDSPPEPSWVPGAIAGELDTTALCALVLASRGRPDQARATLALLGKHAADVARSSHATALSLLAIHAANPSASVQSLRNALVAGQLRGGLWSYRLASKSRGAPELPSSYWAATALSVAPSTDMSKAEAGVWRSLYSAMTQNGADGGGWDYEGRSRAPASYFQGTFMTSELLRIATERIAKNPRRVRLPRRDRKKGERARERIDARLVSDVDTFLSWLADPALEKPPRSLTWPYHTLYVMTRACHHLNLEGIEDLRWYERTAELLVDWQADDGSWPVRGGGDRQMSLLSRTVIALLCLRPSAPAKPGRSEVTPGAGGAD